MTVDGKCEQGLNVGLRQNVAIIYSNSKCSFTIN